MIAEAAVGLWLISGVGERTGRAVGVAVFMAFAGINLAHWIDGREHCQCFGSSLRVPPVAVLTLDISMAITLALLPVRTVSRTRFGYCAATRVVVGAAVATVSVPLVDVLARPEDGSARLTIETVAEEGHRLALLDSVVGDLDLRSDRWLVLFARRQCKSCRRELSALKRLSGDRRFSHLPDVAIVYVGAAQLDHAAEEDLANVHFGRLSDDNMVPQTPLVVVVHDGVVVKKLASVMEMLPSDFREAP